MEIIRLYKLADAEMFTYADKVISNLQTDIALFSNFDATIDAAFVTQAWNLLNTAKALPTDNVVLDQQVAITEQVKILMQDCRDQYDDMKFFIKKAFKNSVGRQNEFGLNDYNKAMINASEMVRFLDDMYNTADRYRTELTLAGCSNTFINKNRTLSDDLNLLIREQSQIMDSRSTSAEDRIKANNAIWEIVVLISEAAKRVFRKSPANMSRYLRPQPQKVGENTNLEITVAANAHKKAIDSVVTEDTTINLTNTGTTTLNFYVADGQINPMPTSEVLTLAAGETTVLIASDFSPKDTYGNLYVQNIGAVAGKFDAVILTIDN